MGRMLRAFCISSPSTASAEPPLALDVPLGRAGAVAISQGGGYLAQRLQLGVRPSQTPSRSSSSWKTLAR